MIRGVTFDWWHTIAEASPDFDVQMRELRVRGIGRVLEERNVRAESSILRAAYDRQTEYLVGRWKELVDPPPDEQVASFLRFAGLDGLDPELAADVSRSFGGAIRELPPPLYPSIRETLERLRNRGLLVGLVSNTGRTWGRYLRPLQDELGIGRYFDVRVFSDEVGRRKPDPRIFEAALRPMGLRPEEVVHIGDDVDADVAGAKRIGMRAIWFRSDPSANPDARDADGVVRDHSEVPRLLEGWSV